MPVVASTAVNTVFGASKLSVVKTKYSMGSFVRANNGAELSHAATSSNEIVARAIRQFIREVSRGLPSHFETDGWNNWKAAFLGAAVFA